MPQLDLSGITQYIFPIAILVIFVVPVSYTHLDVYKRQPQKRGACRGLYTDGRVPQIKGCSDCGKKQILEEHACAQAGTCLLYTSRCV